MACTTILVGKLASFDGSTMVARTEDSGAAGFNPKKFVVVDRKDQPREYQSVISKVKISLPDNPLRYTATPNATDEEGIWACAGVNEKNVAMTATETITSNERVQASDPLVKGGIGEEDIVTLVLPYINSAREGVLRLGSLLEQFGTYEMNGIGFHDQDEIWWLETIGGHHWMAKRVPDDSYVVIPNQLGIDEFDIDDAYSKAENNMCSKDLREFIDENHLNLSLDAKINPRLCFGSDADSDHIYNTPRSWIIQRFFNRNSNTWDGNDADYRPDSNNIPWARVPERKITIEDVKYVLSHHYQGTEYDVYSKNLEGQKKYRPIGVNRNNVLVLTQIRPYMPESIKSIQWMAFGSTVFNAISPYYTNINRTPEYLSNGSAQVTTANVYWSNRLIAALADARFKENSIHIERYQKKVQADCLALVKKTDKEVLSNNYSYEDASSLLEEANDKIADILKTETSNLLSQVLDQTSKQMQNAFSRSDA